MMNLVKLIEKIETESQNITGNFVFGDIYENLNSKTMRYPVINCDTVNYTISTDDGGGYYSFYIYYCDRQTEDYGNIRYIQAEAIRSLKKLINRLQADGDAYIVTPIVLTTFSQRFSDMVAGCWCELRVSVNDDTYYCEGEE